MCFLKHEEKIEKPVARPNKQRGERKNISATDES